jgi:hypothetical protein
MGGCGDWSWRHKLQGAATEVGEAQQEIWSISKGKRELGMGMEFTWQEEA